MSTLLEQIKDAGVVGAGGAGFPTHVKINKDAEVIIVNGAECEPLLKVDQNLGAQYAKELVRGMQAVLDQTGIPKAIFAFKYKYKDAIAAVNQAIGGDSRLGVFELPSVYPVGDEVILTYDILGKVVSKGAIPMEQKVVVVNVETILNIYWKLSGGRNVTHTYVTLIGEVHNPASYRVPVGMTVGQLIELTGGAKLSEYAVLFGGPMTGRMVGDNEPLTKTSKAVIVLPKNHSIVEKKSQVNINHVRRIMATCSQCRNCTDMCPRNLIGHHIEPHKLMNAAANGLLQNHSVIKTALGCCDCGVCELYACDHGLSPRKMMMAVKTELMKNGVRPSGEDMTPVISERDGRKVPTDRLVLRLGLRPYDIEIKLDERELTPAWVKIPLKQHVGAPAKPIVPLNQVVSLGQLLAHMPENALGAAIHASIDGRITEITQEYIKIERLV